MAASYEDRVCVLVGPTCPTCVSDDLRWGAPLGALWHGRCRDCATEYHWFEPTSNDGAVPHPSCPGCGVSRHEVHPATPFCDECGPLDCAYCGTPAVLPTLSRNLACAMCENGEAA